MNAAREHAEAGHAVAAAASRVGYFIVGVLRSERADRHELAHTRTRKTERSPCGVTLNRRGTTPFSCYGIIAPALLA
jgi:hypothetical protein